MAEFSTSSSFLSCSHFPLCSGCEMQGCVAHPPVEEEVKSFFLSINPSLVVPLYVGEVTGWRTRSKLAVRGSALDPKIGLFRRGTHEVVAIPDCPLHHPAINKAYCALREKMVEKKLAPYEEGKLAGLIRYLQFAVERKSRRVQLTVIVNRSGKDPLVEKFVKQLYTERMFLGIWVNYQAESTNRIFGHKWELVAGEPYLWEKLGGVDCAFHPACFIQAHLSLFEQILESIRQSILPNSRIVEFYAGIGVIALSLARLSSEIVCSEVNPYAEECFHLSRLLLTREVQKKVSFVSGKAGENVHLIEGAEVVIVDPPRKGIDPPLLDALLAASHLKQIIYLSCYFPSFKRDSEKLVNQGWRVEKAEGYLLFPGTDHVEVLSVWRK